MTEPQQQLPGTLDAMRAKTDHGEDGYRGCGRQKAVRVGGDLADAGHCREAADRALAESYMSGSVVPVTGGRPIL